MPPARTGTALALLVAGTCLGLIASTRDDSISIAKVVQQSAVTIPAVWVLVALAITAVGAAPTMRLIAWLGIVATFALTILGPTFKLPDWALNLSPLRHVPNLSAASPDWTGLAWLTGFIAIFLAIGFAGFRRRNII